MALCAWNLPPSALPGISPTRGEINMGKALGLGLKLAAFARSRAEIA